MAQNVSTGTTMTLPSDREILITREFDAPRELIWEATTKCEHMQNWWGPKRYTITSCDMDVRPGGKWRIVQRGEDGSEHGFRGEYREVVAPERCVQTFEYEGFPGHISVETLVLEELPGGRTKWVTRSVFDTPEDRDGMLSSGMEDGMRETMDRLAALLQSMKARG